MKLTERSTQVLAVVTAALGLALFTPALASAAFTRPFLRQITGTPRGSFTFTLLGDPAPGIAIDNKNNLWVSEHLAGAPFQLDEFEAPFDGFLTTLEIEGQNTPEQGLTIPDDVAIDNSNEDFYVTGVETLGVSVPNVEVFDSAGAFVRRFGPFAREAYVAVDNSTEPSDHSVGSVYVASMGSIQKFNAEGTPVNFSESGKQSYVSTNEINGTPGESFKGGPGSIAVDSHGDIYVVVNHATYSEIPEVEEFSASGAFLRAFIGAETPGLAGSHVHDGLGGVIEGIALDPVSGHLLVTVLGSEAGNDDISVIDEFETGGEYKYVNQITEVSLGTPLGPLPDIVTDANGDVYALGSCSGSEYSSCKSGDVVDEWGPGAYHPSLTLAEASGRTRTEAVVGGTVNPEGQTLTECTFQYVSEAAFKATGFSVLSSGGSEDCTQPDAAEIGAGKQPVSVHAKLSSLQSGTTYYYRLVAKSSGALGGTAESEPLAFTAPAAPRIDATSVSDVSSRFAELHAQVDPLGAATSAHFEYNMDGTTWVSTPEEEIGSGGPSGDANANVVQQIGPLQPGMLYRVRVSAHSEIEGKLETSVGPEVSFTTLPTTPEGLSDGRAYELVTPANKGSAEDMFAEPIQEHNLFGNHVDVGYPSESGDEFLFEAKSAFGSFDASGHDLDVFRRTNEGWQTTSLASPSLGVQNIFDPLFDPEAFSRVAFADSAGSGGQANDLNELSLLGPPGGPYEEVHQEGVSPVGGVIGTEVAGASRDLSHLVLESLNHTLVPGVDENQDANSNALYEYVDGELTLISVSPEESPFRCGAMLGLSTGGDFGGGERHNAVSSNGSEVFFTAPDPLAPDERSPTGPGCWNGATVNAPQLYMHAGGKTIELSAPEQGVIEEGHAPVLHPALYVGASANGAKVFFLSETELTGEVARLKLHDPELYECEIVEEAEGEKCDLTRISAGVEGTPVREPGSSGAQVGTVATISEDGSAVYFTAFAALAPGATERDVTEAGQINLYRYDTVTDKTVYVATVEARDFPASIDTEHGWYYSGSTRIHREPALDSGANWYTTPDGSYLLFASTSDVTGYSTAEANRPGELDCPGTNGESGDFKHCDEVYRYDSELPVSEGKPGVVNNPSCVSCDPSGTQPESNATFARDAAGLAPDAGGVRAISNDGSYVFFNSADPLVKQADNHTQDVFEWEAQGRGGCEQTQGCLHLIGSGDDPSPSFFLGMSSYVAPDGETVEAGNVFFGTHARLAPQDTDEAGDLYDARIGGGFPVEGGKGPCKGNACENPAPAPIEASPGSLTFSGAGNIVPEVTPAVKTKAKPVKCRKGYVKDKGRCVKQAKKKAKKAKKSSDKRRAK